METDILSTSNVVYVDRDFTNAQFGSKIFDKCTFRNCRFDGMDLSGVTFKVCTAEDVSFDGSNLKGATFNRGSFSNCNFNNSILCDSNFKGTNFSGSKFIRARFDGSDINNINIARCNLNLASFENTKIDCIEYKPTRKIPYLRGLKLFRKGQLQSNTISINGNKYLEFYDYCISERRKDRFVNSTNNAHPIVRPFAVVLLALFGVLTIFGQSFARWTICTLGLISVYALFAVIEADDTFADALVASLRSFFAFENIDGSMQYVFLSESIIGYFMLGTLISLLTTKLTIN